MNTRKYLTWAAVAFAAFMVVTAPTKAADLLHQGGSSLADVANSLTQFVNALT